VLIDAADALTLAAHLLGGSLLLQTLELLLVRRSFSEQGIWTMAVLRQELVQLPAALRVPCLTLFPYPRFVALLVVQAGLAASLLCFGATPLLLPAAAIALLISMRFRGTYNGGSDAMTLLAALCLAIAACAPAYPLVQRGCLGYLALQTCLSYFLAGIAKLKQPSWRQGAALAQFANQPRYAVPARALALLRRPLVSRATGYLVMAFECSFPLALLGPRWCLGYLSVALVFHLNNAALFGLNRFLFAWLAAYPALLYVSGHGPL